ncbi:MAG TPA: DNA-3-methyladenine glycosylase I [Candidatus Binatia bacterium]|nr:DNA-3-methyladenine glycosylase I [Candidatus Binatia bacterium]
MSRAARAVERCPWARGDAYVAYHDREWGVPLHDERALFELLVLEGAQAGLAWITILNKRESYRRAFDGFDPAKVARYGARQVARLMGDAAIVRNRLKIDAAIGNARALLALHDAGRTLHDVLWDVVDGRPVQNAWVSAHDVPARTPASDEMSRTLKKLGFRFVGSTICYAFMQAAGLVNDHLVGCFRHREVRGAVRGRARALRAAPRM